MARNSRDCGEAQEEAYWASETKTVLAREKPDQARPLEDVLEDLDDTTPRGGAA